MADAQTLVRIISAAVTAASLVFGVSVFIINSRRERIKRTLEYWEKINQELKNEKREVLEKYGNPISKETALEILEDKGKRTPINRMINIYERLALGMNYGVYDIHILNKLVGQNIIDNYRRFQAYIDERRRSLSRPLAWSEFESMHLKLLRLRDETRLTKRFSRRLKALRAFRLG